MGAPTDRIDDERRACAQWVGAILADPNKLGQFPEPDSDQLDAAVWAMLTTYHAILAEVSPTVISGVVPAALAALYGARPLEAAGLVRFPRTRPVRSTTPVGPHATRVRQVLATVSVMVLSVLIFLGAFSAFLIVVGVRAG